MLVDVTPPDDPVISVTPATIESQITTVEISGEAGTSYEVTVASKPQRKAGEIPESGSVEVAFLVENGAHTVAVALTDASGNASEAVADEFDVDLAAPAPPSVEVVSGSGDNPVEVVIRDGPAFGAATVRLDGEEAAADLGADGRGRAQLAVDDGTYDLTVVVTDFQGQSSDPVVVEGVEVGDETSVAEALGGLAVLIALLAGAVWFVRKRLRRREDPGPAPRDAAVVGTAGRPGGHEVIPARSPFFPPPPPPAPASTPEPTPPGTGSGEPPPPPPPAGPRPPATDDDPSRGDRRGCESE